MVEISITKTELLILIHALKIMDNKTKSELQLLDQLESIKNHN